MTGVDELEGCADKDGDPDDDGLRVEVPEGVALGLNSEASADAEGDMLAHAEADGSSEYVAHGVSVAALLKEG